MNDGFEDLQRERLEEGFKSLVAFDLLVGLEVREIPSTS